MIQNNYFKFYYSGLSSSTKIVENLVNKSVCKVFSCFTGLAYIDVKGLKTEHIRTSFDGKTKREKINVDSNIPLLDIPKMIIDKYRRKLAGDILLPALSNQKMNSYLKEIADICDITKNLTFHTARHSFSTLILIKGVPIESVSKMPGHTNIKTTQIYRAHIIDVKVSQNMVSFAQKLVEKNIESQANIDNLFECLSLIKKMTLFNLPETLPNDPERAKRISLMWKNLSEEEKLSLWFIFTDKINKGSQSEDWRIQCFSGFSNFFQINPLQVRLG